MATDTVEKLAMKDSRMTKSAGSTYSESEQEIFIANSNGLSKTYKASDCSMGVTVVKEARRRSARLSTKAR